MVVARELSCKRGGSSPGVLHGHTWQETEQKSKGWAAAGSPFQVSQMKLARPERRGRGHSPPAVQWTSATLSLLQGVKVTNSHQLLLLLLLQKM